MRLWVLCVAHGCTGTRMCKRPRRVLFVYVCLRHITVHEADIGCIVIYTKGMER